MPRWKSRAEAKIQMGKNPQKFSTVLKEILHPFSPPNQTHFQIQLKSTNPTSKFFNKNL